MTQENKASEAFIASNIHIPVQKYATDAFSVLNKIFVGYTVSDRFGILNPQSSLNIANTGASKPTKFNKLPPLTDLIDKRAKEIVSKYKSIVVVCLKGIIDDVVLLSAIISHMTDDNTVNVYIADCAASNNPEILKFLKNHSVQIHQSSNIDIWDDIGECECDVIVTSFGGTHLVSGYPAIRSKSYDETVTLCETPWREGLRTAISNKLPYIAQQLNEDETIKIINDIENACMQYINYFDIEITTFGDLARLMAWGLTRQQTAYLSTLKIAKYPNNRNKAISFFDDDSFDSWFLSSLNSEEYSTDSQIRLSVLTDYTKTHGYLDQINVQIDGTEMKCGKPATRSIVVLTDNGFKKFTMTNGDLTCGICANKIYNAIRDFFSKANI